MLLKRLTALSFLALLFSLESARADYVYQQPDEFLKEVFASEPPEPELLAISGQRRARAAEILGHPPSLLRARYWRRGVRSAWILEEIGKSKPITTGIIIDNSKIEDIRVLIYRESHGGEVRHEFFTKQFSNAGLNEKGTLDTTVDGISGATLSVNAMRKLATLALYFDAEVRSQ